jgi:osmoprotectant transport system permease protein
MSLSLVQRSNPVLALYVALAIGAAGGLPFLRVAPNRLLSGEPVYLWDVLQQVGNQQIDALLLGLVVLLCIAVWQPGQRLIQALLILTMAVSLSGVWLLAGHFASSAAQAENPLLRTSLGAGFWTLAALAWLIALDAIARVQLPTLPRLFLQSAFFLPLLLLLLAWRMTRTRSLRQALFPILNVIQTIPSIALFGLLMAPLAWLAVQLPALGRAGISGVGIAPAVIALFMYALLPIVRSALAGLEQVPAEAVNAARAMGMSAGQLLWQVQLPLALPVLLIGLRSAVVQTTGLAAVSALVGAGGLGQIMFDGLFSAANELVILGVIPIVLLAMLADTFFKVLSSLIKTRP